MMLKTLEWATAQRAALAGEIDTLAEAGVRQAADLVMITRKRAELDRLDVLIAALRVIPPEPALVCVVDEPSPPGDPIGAPAEPS